MKERRVELEGIEPSSKQGNPELSTRLFRTEFSSEGKTRTTDPHLILWISSRMRGHARLSPILLCHWIRALRSNSLWVTSRLSI